MSWEAPSLSIGNGTTEESIAARWRMPRLLQKAEDRAVGRESTVSRDPKGFQFDVQLDYNDSSCQERNP
jgi:hypothetical protein